MRQMLSYLLNLISKLTIIIISANLMMSIIAMFCFNEKLRIWFVITIYNIVKLLSYICISIGCYVLISKYIERQTNIRNATILQTITKKRLYQNDIKTYTEKKELREKQEQHQEQEQHHEQEQHQEQDQVVPSTPKQPIRIPNSPPKLRSRKHTQTYLYRNDNIRGKRLNYDSPNELW